MAFSTFARSAEPMPRFSSCAMNSRNRLRLMASASVNMTLFCGDRRRGWRFQRKHEVADGWHQVVVVFDPQQPDVLHARTEPRVLLDQLLDHQRGLHGIGMGCISEVDASLPASEP